MSSGLIACLFCSRTYEMDSYVAAFERCIVGNDEYAGSDAGLLCLLALRLCYMNTRPCRAWLTIRKAILGLLYFDPPSPSPQGLQVGTKHVQGWKIVNKILEALEVSSRGTLDQLCGRCYTALKTLAESGDTIKEGEGVDVGWPYIGSITIGPSQQGLPGDVSNDTAVEYADQANSMPVYDMNDISLQYHGPFLHDDDVDHDIFQGLFSSGFDWSNLDVDRHWDWLAADHEFVPTQ